MKLALSCSRNSTCAITQRSLQQQDKRPNTRSSQSISGARTPRPVGGPIDDRQKNTDALLFSCAARFATAACYGSGAGSMDFVGHPDSQTDCIVKSVSLTPEGARLEQPAPSTATAGSRVNRGAQVPKCFVREIDSSQFNRARYVVCSRRACNRISRREPLANFVINRGACQQIPVRHPVNDPLAGWGEGERARWFLVPAQRAIDTH